MYQKCCEQNFLLTKCKISGPNLILDLDLALKKATNVLSYIIRQAKGIIGWCLAFIGGYSVGLVGVYSSIHWHRLVVCV